MKIFNLIVMSLISSTILFGQVKNYKINSPKWGDDLLIVDHDISGKFAGVQLPSGTIFQARVDSITDPYAGMQIVFSTDNGASWSPFSAYSEKGAYGNIKMFYQTNHNPLLVFQVDNRIFCCDLSLSNVTQIPIDHAISFDAVTSINGSLIVFADSSNNYIYRFTSTDNGQTWPQVYALTNDGARPKVSRSGTGDTVLVTYYSNLQPTLGNSAIYLARYSINSQGLLVFISTDEVIPSGEFKTEFQSAKLNDKVWTIYNVWEGSNIDIFGRISTDGGVNFVSTVPIANNQSFQEYWFDLYANPNNMSFELIFYSDSLQSGPSDNNSDKLIYTYSPFSLNQFTILYQISNHPPYWAPQDYSPKILPIPFTSDNTDFLVFWMGIDGGIGKLYSNKKSAISNVEPKQSELPSDYRLYQNYPNPFNPRTIINYNLPLYSSVTIKIYDILGSEIETLVHESLPAGMHSTEWDASKYPSGIYYYELRVNNYHETRKMQLIK